MSNVNFLIAYVISFVSGAVITFSQISAAKMKFKQFSEFGSRTICISSVLELSQDL